MWRSRECTTDCRSSLPAKRRSSCKMAMVYRRVSAAAGSWLSRRQAESCSRPNLMPWGVPNTVSTESGSKQKREWMEASTKGSGQLPVFAARSTMRAAWATPARAKVRCSRMVRSVIVRARSRRHRGTQSPGRTLPIALV